MRRLVSGILVILMMFSLQTSVMALTNSYSVEDLITLFETEGTLPSWKEIQEVKRAEWDTSDIEDKDELAEYKRKKELAEKIILGFQKSSKYNEFKKMFETYCEYNEEYEEVLPKGYSDDSVSEKQYAENEKYYAKFCNKFDTAISEASMRELMDTQELASTDNKITRFFQAGSDLIIGTSMNILLHLDRIGLTIVSGQIAIELLYISTDWLRPILGFEWGIRKRKVKRDDYVALLGGDSVYTDDHGSVFRIVGYAARQAVEQEYKINEDMSAAFRNDVLLCYLSKKWKQIVLVALSLLVVATGAWGSLCLVFIRLISNIVSV